MTFLAEWGLLSATVVLFLAMSGIVWFIMDYCATRYAANKSYRIEVEVDGLERRVTALEKPITRKR